jgi:hypothetical protein
MDKFGPVDDQELVDMDDDEAANLLAEDEFKVVSNKVKPKTQPKP